MSIFLSVHVRIEMMFLSCEVSRLTHGVVGQLQVLILSGFPVLNYIVMLRNLSSNTELYSR